MKFFKTLLSTLRSRTPAKPFNGSLGNTILAFQHTIQKSIEWKELKQVEFAMWIPSEKDKVFSKSPLVTKWSTIYDLTKNNWTYIAADLLKTLKLMQDETFRLELPEQFQSFAFLTSTNEQVVLSMSQEKGIRFHFAETTPLEYKLTFLTHFIEYCQAWTELVQQNRGEVDADIGFAAWWELTVEATSAAEHTEPIKAVGKIIK